MRKVREKEKLSLLLSASIPDPSKLLFHLSTTPRLSEESEGDSESDGDVEGAADEGVEGWAERKEERRRRGRNGETEGLDWLSDCIIESWGGLEYVALARSSSIALLGRRGDALSILFAKPLPMEVGEEISSILLMGMGSRRVPGSIDGIILLVGTSDGRFSLFSESSSLLFSHRFVHTPITAMRTTEENVLLISEHEMVQIERSSLYTLVGEARKINGKKRMELDFSLLNRMSVEVSMDGVACPRGPSPIDRYAECSLKKFHGKVERSRGDSVFWMSLRESYGATGIWESESREGVRDTIVKWGTQYLPSFLQSAMQSPELAPRETKSAVTWRVMGESRFAISLHPAPSECPLVAVADNLARVAIVESSTGQMVRVWKGYRDASCGWVRVAGDGGKRAVFLVILAPRRNLLEIWSAPNGRRVAARQVRGLALLQSSSQVLAESTKKGKEEGDAEDRLFLLGYKGNLYEIKVAFESLLQLNTDDEQHDRILLKETEMPSISGLPSLVSSLKTGAAKRMALISCIHTARTVEETEASLKELNQVESISPLCTSLLSLCQSYGRLSGLWRRERTSITLDLPHSFDREAYEELLPLIEACLAERK
ncbi:hypothetical protein PMAYCL1PPCAC_24287, partial [Pristionchus mayeri]